MSEQKQKRKYVEYYRDPTTKTYTRKDEIREYSKPKQLGVFHTIRHIEKTGEIKVPVWYKSEKITSENDKQGYKFRLTGSRIIKFHDRPTLTKKIYNWKPKSAVGKSLKSTAKIYNTTGKVAWKTTISAGVVGEKLLRKTDELGTRLAVRQLKKSIRKNTSDDMSLVIVKTATSAGRAFIASRAGKRYYKSTKRYVKTHKRDFKRTKFSLRKKGRNRGVEYEKLVKVRNDLNIQLKPLKKQRNLYHKSAHKSKKGVVSQLNYRRLKAAKSDIKIIQYKKKVAKKRFTYKRKILKYNKKLLFLSKNATLLTAVDGVKNKAGEKLREAGADNDFVKLAGTVSDISKRTGLTKTTSQKLHSQNSKTKKLETKSKKAESKFVKKESKLKGKKKSKAISTRTRGRKLVRNFKAGVASKITAITGAFSDPKQLLKSVAVKAVLPALIPILLIVIPIFIIISMLVPAGGATTVSLTIYPATDQTLTGASEYFQSLASDDNFYILRFETDWKGSLRHFGVDISTYNLNPEKIYWNASPILTSNTAFEYSPYKLWAYLTALNADDELFEETKDDEEPPDLVEWTLNSVVRLQIKSLYEEMYEFRHKYLKFDKTIPGEPVYLYDDGIPSYYEYEDGTAGSEPEKIVDGEAYLYIVMDLEKSMDTVISDFLNTKNYAAERKEYYDFLMEAYGSHQTLISPFGESITEQNIIRKSGSGFTAWNYPNSAEHKGIDVAVPQNTPIYAVTDGKIQNAGSSDFTLYTSDILYYDSTEDKYLAYINYANVRIKSGIKSGDTVEKGQEIGYVSADKMCVESGTNTYLHIQIIAVQKGKFVNIDPLLLLE